MAYIHDEAVGGKWEDLPADWKCPVCKAGKDAFKPKEEKTASQEVLEKPHVDKELSPMEMSIICSNLARGCEKQYLPQQADDFRTLAEFFRSKAAPVEEASTAKLLELIDKDLSVGYPYIYNMRRNCGTDCRLFVRYRRSLGYTSGCD